MPRVLQSALQHAVSKRGVSVIVVSGDVAATAVSSDTSAQGLVTAAPLVRSADADLARLAPAPGTAGPDQVA
jgi:pyruvate dehydrogenase (quinone)